VDHLERKRPPQGRIPAASAGSDHRGTASVYDGRTASGRVQVAFDCHDPASLATFWAAVLGYRPPDIQPEPKRVKNRVHLDVGVSPAGPGQRREIDEEAKRVVGLGGRILRSVTDDSGYFVVMQDPEGNEFCID